MRTQSAKSTFVRVAAGRLLNARVNTRVSRGAGAVVDDMVSRSAEGEQARDSPAEDGING